MFSYMYYPLSFSKQLLDHTAPPSFYFFLSGDTCFLIFCETHWSSKLYKKLSCNEVDNKCFIWGRSYRMKQWLSPLLIYNFFQIDLQSHIMDLFNIFHDRSATTENCLDDMEICNHFKSSIIFFLLSNNIFIVFIPFFKYC